MRDLLASHMRSLTCLLPRIALRRLFSATEGRLFLNEEDVILQGLDPYDPKEMVMELGGM